MNKSKLGEVFMLFSLGSKKRGWIKMLEVTIAISIMAGAILFVYSINVESITFKEHIYMYQKEILSKIATDEVLRGYVMDENIGALEDSVFLPSSLSFSIKVCDLTVPPTPCNMDNDLFIVLREKEIFAGDTIVVANLTSYSPKRVKLFIWEN